MIRVVNVKPLVWHYYEADHDYGSGMWEAYTPWSSYKIMNCDRIDIAPDHRYYCPQVSDQFSTLEMAKKAANKHHESRILSCLGS